MGGLRAFKNLCVGMFAVSAIAAAVLFGIGFAREDAMETLEIAGGGTGFL